MGGIAGGIPAALRFERDARRWRFVLPLLSQGHICTVFESVKNEYDEQYHLGLRVYSFESTYSLVPSIGHRRYGTVDLRRYGSSGPFRSPGIFFRFGS